MRVLWKGYLSKNHSWSIVAQNISRSLISMGHQVDLYSTNGIEYFPEDLKPNMIGYRAEDKQTYGRLPDKSYDLCLSYTAMKNFGEHLSYSQKNRLGIWSYEFDGKNSLPLGFAKQYNNCDYLLAPSEFSKQVFITSGIPANKIKVISHGVNYNEINSALPYKLKTNKSTKILINLGQLHKRKGLGIALEVFGKSFTNKDDVCLILKIQDKNPLQQFEVSFNSIYAQFIKNFPNHAEVEIITSFIPNIYSLYKSCDIMFSTTHTECFGMPHLEALSMGLINVCPRYGGMLDFLNDENSILIDGKKMIVPADWLYYQKKPGTFAFNPDLDDGIIKLQSAVKNKNDWKNKINTILPVIKEKYDWSVITNQILSLVK